MRRSKSVTLNDVALAAGVAKMTASVVLNGARSGTRVSDATRARIIETATRLGYRPNSIARGLSRRRMDSIGVVAVRYLGLNLYFLELFNGILQAAADNKQATVVYTIEGWNMPDIERELLRLCDGRVDGLILLGPHIFSRPIVEAIQQHTPLVAIHGAKTPDSLPNVDIDNEKGMYLTTKHLIERGHRRIAHFQGRIEETFEEAGAEERYLGYRRALEEAGIPIEPAWVLPGHFTADSGIEQVDRLLQTGLPLPTAITCANDAIAYGCIDALKTRGIRVPEDISVTGFDDVLSTQAIAPTLTTIRQPFNQLGRRATEILLQEIDGRAENEETHEPRTRSEILDVELIVRSSTAPPPSHT